MSILRPMVGLLLVCVCGFVGAQGEVVPSGGAPRQFITVVLDDNYPPFSFRDAQGQLQGILKDSWALWQKHTGVEVKFKAMDWPAALHTLQAAQADVIDPIMKTDARQKTYDFSQPYTRIEIPIFFNQGISGIVNADSLNGFTVGVKAGTVCADSLLARGAASLRHYPSYDAVVQAAVAGDIHVFCMGEPAAVYLLTQQGVAKNFRHTEAVFSGEFHRAVRKGDAAMLTLVENGFSKITASEYRQIEEKWYGSAIHELGESPIIRYLRYVVLVIILLVLVLVLWNLMLRRRVQEKTRILSESMAELSQAKQTAEQALGRLQKLADRVPGMVYQFQLHPDGRTCLPFTNNALREVYRADPQVAREDASGVLATIHPDDRAGVLQSIADSARDLSPWQQEFRVRYDDGTVRWVFGNSLPERLEDGSVLWHGFNTDITERRLDDERLRQLSRVVEQAPMAIVITDLQSNIQYANPAFTRVTGYTVEEMRGQNPRVLKSGLTPPEVYLDLWKTLGQGSVWQGEMHNRKKNGEIFIEHAVIAPVLDATGHATHYVALKEDITLRKQADLALQTSLQEKVALLNEVHHRVKNNLQVISSLLRLESGRSAQTETKRVLKDMQGRILSMALLHETLYRVGNFASVDLAAYLKQLATQAFRAQGSQIGAVRLVLNLAPAAVAIDLATPCGLLINELLSNCLKHGFPEGRGGEVQVTSAPVDISGLWRLCVQDTGIGLPQDFELRRTQSLGLQLAVDLARQLGGTLEIGAGPGARFDVIFALVSPKVPTQPSGVSSI